MWEKQQLMSNEGMLDFKLDTKGDVSYRADRENFKKAEDKARKKLSKKDFQRWQKLNTRLQFTEEA